MAIQTFVADTILTAAQMNALQGNDYNQTVSTKTASYTLVAADKGTKIVMNSASATTITVNTSLFSAGDTLTILNIAAGVCTVTAGTATVSTTGTLALVQNAGGTLYFTSAGVSVFQADGVTAAAGGLVFIASGTVTAGASLSFDNCFSATYANYLIKLTHTAANNPTMRLRAGAADITAANYDMNTPNYQTGAAGGSSSNSATSWTVSNGSGYSAPTISLGNPFAATNTAISVDFMRADSSIWQYMGGRYNATTSADGFTILGTTITVTARVYGYTNS